MSVESALRRFSLRSFVLLLSVAGVSVVATAAPLFTPGMHRFPPVATSAAAPNRQALVIVPAFSGGGESLRGATAQSDAAAYRDLLRLLGFAVTVVAADTRPSLDLETRRFAGALQPDADVAVFVLGAVIGAGNKLYIPASDLSDLERKPDQIVSEGLNVAEVLQRIRDRSPREVVAIVDECGAGEPNPTCAVGNGTLPDGVGAIVAKRVSRGSGGEPLAGMASLRQELLPLMREPDLPFLDLYRRLKGKLDGTNLGLVTTPALSRNFAFLPGEFLQKLPTQCNEVDAATSAETLRGMPEVTQLISACERATRTWSFANHFKEKLATAREQLALQKALAICEGNAAQVYLDTYREGAYRFAVNDQVDKCEREKAPKPVPPPRAPPPSVNLPVAQEPSLQQRAYTAVITYYDRHNYKEGDSLDGLTSLYPRMFSFEGSPRSGAQQVQELRKYYYTLASFQISVVPGSLDFNGCTSAYSCLVRGKSQVAFQKIGDGNTKYGLSSFSLRFNLNPPIKVLYECSDRVPPRKSTPCE